MASLKKCENCDSEISKRAKKCPHCGTQVIKENNKKGKKRNILLFFLKMVLLFIIVDIFTTFIPVYVGESVFNYKYGQEFVVEALWCLCIVFILLISGNSYVFTQKKEKFWKSIFLGLPMLIIGISSFIGSALGLILEGVKLWNLVNLVLFCATIGLTEEFLCRGWIQNEFIERFGDTRKNVILSIICSALVFGLMHITNILAGQGVVETIMQICQATALGALLGSVYYRTKNIWAVAFLHGFYDFGILLSDVNLIKDCTTGTVTYGILAYQIFSSIILIALYVISTIIILRKKDTHKLIDEKSELTQEEIAKDQKINNFAWIGIAVVFALLYLPIDFDIEGADEYQICYTYDEKTILGYETHFSNYGSYDIYYEKSSSDSQDLIQENGWNGNNPDAIEYARKEFDYELYYDNENDKLVFGNLNTNDKVMFDNEYVYDYLVIYNERNFIIMYYDYNEEKIYYTKINDEDLDDSKEFLEDVKNSFIDFDVPELGSIGYLTTDNSSDAYAYMESKLGDKFIIDENDEIYLLK